MGSLSTATEATSGTLTRAYLEEVIESMRDEQPPAPQYMMLNPNDRRQHRIAEAALGLEPGTIARHFGLEMNVPP